MDYIDSAICERIKEVMKETVSGQKELMEKTGVAQSTISAILNGKRQPTPLIDAMCETFGINREWLMSGIGFKYKESKDITKCDNIVISDRVSVLREINALYQRHQSLLAEAGEVMKTIVELNKRVLLSGVE